MQRVISLDVETSSKPIFYPWQQDAFLVMLSIVELDGKKHSWIFNHNDVSDVDQTKNIKEIQKMIDDSTLIVGQNFKFDMNWMRKIGLNFDDKDVFCTLIADYYIHGSKRMERNLDSIAERWDVEKKIDKVKMYWDSGYNTNEIPLSILIPYCERDCSISLDIYQRMLPVIVQEGLDKPIYLANSFSKLLSEIECTGILADREEGMRLVGDIQHQLDLLDLGLQEMLGDINMSSGDELSAALYGGVIKRKGRETVHRVLKSGEVKEYRRNCIIEESIDGAGFKPLKGTELKKGGHYQTNIGVIEQLSARTKKQKEIKNGLIARSAVAKSLESLWGEKEDAGVIKKIQHDNCIHPKYNQTVAVTGRLSSSDPNGQNLPREGTSPIKRIFIPRYDQIVSADVGTLEWTVGALLSQDAIMIQEIWDGLDVHHHNAVNFFGDESFRTIAKFMTFRLLYGGTAYGFFMDHKMPNFSLKKWESIVDAFYAKYTGLKEWQNENIRTVNRTGRLYIPSGRFFSFQKFKDGFNVRHIKNYPVQGFSFDIVALAMLIIRSRMRDVGLKSLIIAQVHDEVVFDLIRHEFKDVGRICLDTFYNIPSYMKKFWEFECNVPFTGAISYGKNYESMEEMDNNYFMV